MKYIILILLCGSLWAKTEISTGFAGGQYTTGTLRDYKGAIKYAGDSYSWGLKGSYRTAGDFKAGKGRVYLNRSGKKLYYKTGYSYQEARDEHQGSVDAGWFVSERFAMSLGYIASYKAEFAPMWAVKLNFPLTERFTYRYHCRGDLSAYGDRAYEWWQQWEYNLDMYHWGGIAFKYQLDRQFGFTEHEYSTNFILKWR